MNILLIGSGGREHAIACKLAESDHCTQLFVAPGNAGTATLKKCKNIDMDPMDFEAVGNFVRQSDIKMMVVGPEAPLVAGIADYFASTTQLRSVMVIGPRKAGAMLEGSKDYAKDFMIRHSIPTAAYKTFTVETLNKAMKYLEKLRPPYVLKADGLAAGKGVLILDDLAKARIELQAMLKSGKFGDASKKVVIEEYLNGIELSVFALTDGKHYMILPSAKDYKRIGEGDTGLNTGGMGSVSPVPFADAQFMRKVEERIVMPTVKGLHQEGTHYKGFIFFGLMAVPCSEGGYDPYVIEYNVRMGDPETESVFPRIKSDIVKLFEHVWSGNLQQTTIDIDPRAAACVMMVAEGYPGSYLKGLPITGIDQVTDSTVFHAGTRLDNDGSVLTNGGRVLCVTSLDNYLPSALLKTYQSVDKINWAGKQFRRDIGQDVLRMMFK